MTRHEIALNLSKVGTYGGSGAGIMSWLSINSDAITAMVAVLSLVIALASFFLRVWLEIHEERRREIVFEQVQEERRQHLNKDTGERHRKTDKET